MASTRPQESALFAFDFDETITSRHVYFAIVAAKLKSTRGVDLTDQQYAIASTIEPRGSAAQWRELFEKLIADGHKIAIVTYNPFELVVQRYLKEKLGLSDDVLEKISFNCIHHNAKYLGKDRQIAAAKAHFEIDDNRNIILVEDDITNLLRARIQGMSIVLAPTNPEDADLRSNLKTYLTAPHIAQVAKLSDTLKVVLAASSDVVEIKDAVITRESKIEKSVPDVKEVDDSFTEPTMSITFNRKSIKSLKIPLSAVQDFSILELKQLVLKKRDSALDKADLIFYITKGFLDKKNDEYAMLRDNKKVKEYVVADSSVVLDSTVTYAPVVVAVNPNPVSQLLPPQDKSYLFSVKDGSGVLQQKTDDSMVFCLVEYDHEDLFVKSEWILCKTTKGQEMHILWDNTHYTVLGQAEVPLLKDIKDVIQFCKEKYQCELITPANFAEAAVPAKSSSSVFGVFNSGAVSGSSTSSTTPAQESKISTNIPPKK